MSLMDSHERLLADTLNHVADQIDQATAALKAKSDTK